MIEQTSDLEPKRASLFCLVSIFVVALYLLFAVRVSSREVVKGRIVFASTLSSVSSPIDGYVERLFVVPGQAVKAGEKIALVRHSRHMSEEGLDYAQASKNVVRRAEITELREKNQRDILLIERDQLVRKRGALASERDAIQKQCKLNDRAIQLHQKAIERSRALMSQGFYSAAAGEEKEREGLDLEFRREDLRKALQGLEASIVEIGNQINATTVRLERVKLDSRIEIENLRYQLGEIGLKTTAFLVALSDGAIDSVNVRVGDEVRQGQKLASINSGGENFSIELDLPSTAAGFVQVGQAVDVRYDAFPYLKYGVGQGEVVSVGRTSARTGSDPENKLGASFRAVAKASLPPRLKWDTVFVVRDQMGVQTEIITENKRVFDWVFDPLIAANRFVR